MRFFCVILLLTVLQNLSFAQKEWYLNFSPGLSYAFPAPLIIQQEGFPKISFWAKYKTEPLRMPIYYSYRIGFFNNAKGWDLEMNHLKVILKNNPEEIQQFSITHGYNQVFVNRAIKKPNFGYKYGAGVVLAHPENIVRNLHLNEDNGIFGSGYYLKDQQLRLGFLKKSISPAGFSYWLKVKSASLTPMFRFREEELMLQYWLFICNWGPVFI